MKKIKQWFHQWGALEFAYRRLVKMESWLTCLSIILLAVGLWLGLYVAPPDYQQGDAFRIIYIHVPAAFYSMGLYFAMALFSGVFLVFRIKLAAILGQACASIGAWVTFCALITGAIWGKPMWGTWWVWDARLTSEFILLFLYWGYLALHQIIPNREHARKASALLAVIGLIDLPLIHFSVQWWSTLHQGATLSKLAKPSMAPEMLWPLLVCLLAFFVFFSLLVLLKAKNLILEQSLLLRWIHKK